MIKKSSAFDKFVNFKTKKRADITTLFEHPSAFKGVVDEMTKPFGKVKIDKIVGLDALGFILASGMALKMRRPLILIRKKGKLPYPSSALLRIDARGVKTDKDNNPSRKLEIRKDSIKKGDQVLLVDEWIHTGTQVLAAVKIIEKLGGRVVGIACYSANLNEKTNVLFDKYNLKQVRK
ncbi:MAG: adenine phosphoribosyltransferase [Candidatus Liptonbacteria bacterium]|nr:adenine phosphoribosyltransferase [Candidatus Pacearchaeota archaeon]MBM3257020.1 adenine phosphoribosyltransferase [Candidatus Liptonbacteria bacterium]